MDTNKKTTSFDVVIPYKHAYPDTELFFSIKSLRNIPHRDVYLVGDKPLWYEGKYLSVDKYKWIIHNPIHNVENKIREACRNPDVSEDLILSNDDFFIMKPTELGVYHRGPMINHLNARKHKDRYTRSLQQTYDILRQMGVSEPLSYELHIPMLLNKKKRLELSYDVEKWFQKGQSPLMRSMYGNLFITNSEYMDDVKNISNFKDTVYLSTSEASFKQDIGNHIKLVLT